jgi:tetratricopeptide (TPR) repeat protein
MSTLARIIVCALLIAVGGTTASAQDYTQLKAWCFVNGTDDQTIQGCNAVVTSGQLSSADKGNAIANRGLAYRQKGQLDRALEDFNEAVRLNPNNPNNYNFRGTCYDALKQYDRAIQDYDHALKLYPYSFAVYLNRGITYVHLGQLDHGIEDYTQGIKLNPNEVMAYQNRGNAYKRKGQLDLARADFDKVQQLKKDGY